MSNPFDLASRGNHPQDTIIESGGLKIGGRNFALIAGPCAVENEEQMHRIGALLKKHDVPFLRGGAYKPRTSPYRFQGLGLDGLKLMREVADTYGLQVVTEIMDYSLIDEVYAYADILQVGARNMKNYHFLKLLGGTDKPILLKRGMDATIEEWLLAAEYILLGGNQQVILCERGIRTFDDSVRNTFDTVSIPLVQSLSHLPVIADPSQGTGNRQLVEAASMAAVAAGAQGLMIEVHNEPETALSDGPQSLYPEQFDQLLMRLEGLLKWAGKLHWKQDTTNPVMEEKVEIQP
jgi:3-deoxy-7-phosphoheptulonate synthase